MKVDTQTSNSQNLCIDCRRVGGQWLWEIMFGDTQRSGWADSKFEAELAAQEALLDLDVSSALAAALWE